MSHSTRYRDGASLGARQEQLPLGDEARFDGGPKLTNHFKIHGVVLKLLGGRCLGKKISIIVIIAETLLDLIIPMRTTSQWPHRPLNH